MSAVVLLGVTGGIAAYKSPLLVRLLVQQGKKVHVVMTRSASKFVTPLTLATVSENRVHDDMWAELHAPNMDHISLGDSADIAVIAPATANIIGKLASGIADDLLTTMVMALTCPVLVCPSMNVNMYRNKVVQDNLNRLRRAGYHILEPEAGYLACGWIGEGRLPEPEIIAQAIDRLLPRRDLEGLKVLVTAGPTEEPIDPVRFLTNRSSGKMGIAIANRAMARGAEVTLVAGPLKAVPPQGLKHIRIRTAQEMFDEVMGLAGAMDVIVKAAAVADFRPVSVAKEKIKKEHAEPVVELERNPDILMNLGRVKSDSQILVGFAAETENPLVHARRKLKAKNLDMLVLNDVSQPGAGFDHDTNIVHFLLRSGEEERLDILPKEKVADLLLDRVRELRRSSANGPQGQSGD